MVVTNITQGPLDPPHFLLQTVEEHGEVTRAQVAMHYAMVLFNADVSLYSDGGTNISRNEERKHFARARLDAEAWVQTLPENGEEDEALAGEALPEDEEEDKALASEALTVRKKGKAPKAHDPALHDDFQGNEKWHALSVYARADFKKRVKKNDNYLSIAYGIWPKHWGELVRLCKMC